MKDSMTMALHVSTTEHGEIRFKTAYWSQASTGTWSSTTETIDQFLNNTQNGNSSKGTIIFLPASLVLRINLSVQRKQKPHLERIIPTLAEDYISESIENFVFDHETIQDNEDEIDVYIYCIKKEHLARITEDLENLKIYVDKIFCAQQIADNLIGSESKIVVSNEKFSKLDNELYCLPNIKPELDLKNENIKTIVSPQDYKKGLSGAQSIFSGAYIRPKKTLLNFTLLALTLCLLSIPALNYKKTTKLEKILETQKEINHKLYKSAFPKDRRIVNIKTQTINHLKNYKHTPDHVFLELLSKYSKFANDMKSIKIHNIYFEESNSTLRINLTGKSVKQLESLSTKISGNTTDSKLSSIENKPGKSRATLNLKRLDP